MLLAAAPLAGALGAQTPTTQPPGAQRPTTATDSARRAPGTTPGDSTRGTFLDRVRARAGQADSAITPAMDPARMLDAELRVALFQLLNDQHIPALQRLQSTTAANAPTGTGSAGMLGRNDGLFLLAQSYWRLGMDQAFRQTATQLAGASDAARYQPILRAQLLLDAYRHGDYPRALQMAQQLSASPISDLASLVAGLTYYQQGQWAQARTSFAASAGASGPYAQYARYMDALTQLRADTAQTATALQSLEALAGSASGEFGEQVRLTAAQLAYEAGRYDVAARLATAIPVTSGLGAEALLTRAWSLYKANEVGAAAQAFQEFATRFPNLPAREEARLMYAQVLLQQGRTDSASMVFRSVADSVRSSVATLEARASGAMGDAARALVTARAAGLLFITDPASGKTIALSDAAGTDASVLASVTQTSTTVAPRVTSPEIISLTDVEQRLQSIGPAMSEVPRRVMYVPASATNNRVAYAGDAQALYDADVAVAVARYQVQEAMEAQQRQLAMLRALQTRLAADSAAFNTFATRIQAAQDSLARLNAVLDVAGSRLRQMFLMQVNTTRTLATENERMVDSVRGSIGASASERDRFVLDTELRTAQIYRSVAELIERSIDSAIVRHPVWAKRDSVRARGDSSRLALASARDALASAQTLIASEIMRLQGSDFTAPYQQALSAAEQRRAAAETQLVATVTRELDARATELLADLRRDVEAAEFGSASAAFFEALEANRAAPAAGTTGASGGMASGAATGASTPAPVPTTSSPRK